MAAPQLDLLSAQLQGSPARGHGAAPLHRAVVPRRSDCAGGRPSPVFRCRREAFRAFQTAWRQAFGTADSSAAAMDRVLHRARVEPRTRRQIRFDATLDDCLTGVFVLAGPARPGALSGLGDRLLPWRASGYGSSRPGRGNRLPRADARADRCGCPGRVRAGAPSFGRRAPSLMAGHLAAAASSAQPGGLALIGAGLIRLSHLARSSRR